MLDREAAVLVEPVAAQERLVGIELRHCVECHGTRQVQVLLAHLAPKEHDLGARKIEACKVRNREVPGDYGYLLLALEMTHELVRSCPDVGNDYVPILDHLCSCMRNAVLGSDVEVDPFLRIAHEHGACERDCSAANAPHFSSGLKGNEVVANRDVRHPELLLHVRDCDAWIAVQPFKNERLSICWSRFLGGHLLPSLSKVGARYCGKHAYVHLRVPISK